jgi:hypothetical protein
MIRFVISNTGTIDPQEWGKGYATEASRLILRFGFDELGLHRIGRKWLQRICNHGSVVWYAPEEDLIWVFGDSGDTLLMLY